MKPRKLFLLIGLASVALGVIVFAACGGGDDDDSGGGGGSGSDEAFVGGLCDAFLTFSTDLDKLFKDPSKLADEEDAAKAFAEPFADLAKAFDKLKPPKDLQDWHDEASDALNKVAKDLKAGNADSEVFASDSPFPDPPKEAGDRLSKVAEKNKTCQEADFDFSS